jgi:hypothetical protein
VKSFWYWIVALFSNRYEVTIWYDPLKKTVYEFKYLEEVSPNVLKGRLASKEVFELRTQDKFNYQIRQIR